MAIHQSTTIQSDTFLLPGNDNLHQPTLTIEGDNIVVDFQNALMRGSEAVSHPDQFKGLAVLVRNSQKVTIRNLRIRGYKVALMAEGVDSLLLENCDFSYNYRQRLKSTREQEHLDDWLYYHHNEEDEWLRYGTAVYLKECDYATVHGLTVTGGQNGLMMTRCNKGLFYNNTIQFNSGIGIGLYRSSNNRVMHNRLDWNVRGYSHGFYSRGQDSAGILCYEQSNDNTFAYNSATHSGDGFFLWAGQTTMDTGEGGSNGNLIYGNDFSYAPTNGVEVTFSSNTIAKNTMRECRYGIWGGYSFETVVVGNEIEDCDYGLAIEHGQENAIYNNLFIDCEQGIKLWEREKQREDWGYAQAKDVSSRDYTIGRNAFLNVDQPLVIAASKKVAINDDNQFVAFRKLLLGDPPNEQLVMAKNDVYGLEGWADAASFKELNRLHSSDTPTKNVLKEQTVALADLADIQPEKLPDGIVVDLPEGQLAGRKYILIDEWGPYDFRRPSIWLRHQAGRQYTFLLLGPPGNWKLAGGEGFSRVTPKTGTFPATITAQASADSVQVSVQLEFVGTAVRTQFGEDLPKGSKVEFTYP